MANPGLAKTEPPGAAGFAGRLDAGSGFSWNHSVVPRRPSVVPAKVRAVVCLLAAIAVGGCTSSASRALNEPGGSSSAPGHGSLTDREFNVAVAVARAEIEKYAATVTSATATVGEGTVTDPNAGPACTSGTLLHIKLIGTFPTIGVGLLPTAGAPDASDANSVTTVLVTADPESGKPCDISVRIDHTTPDPGATQLFAH
jgi:hypothetical protein